MREEVTLRALGEKGDISRTGNAKVLDCFLATMPSASEQKVFGSG
jgi:hypothetical protein